MLSRVFLLVDSTLPLCTMGGCGWVEHNARSDRASLGTLLGPEKTPAVWWGFLGEAIPDPGPSNASRGGHRGVRVGVVAVVGVGVWWCVECCIVDASIFLCLVLWFVRVCCV